MFVAVNGENGIIFARDAQPSILHILCPVVGKVERVSVRSGDDCFMVEEKEPIEYTELIIDQIEAEIQEELQNAHGI